MDEETEKAPSVSDEDLEGRSSNLTEENVRKHTESQSKSRSDSVSSKEGQKLGPLKTPASSNGRGSVVSDITGSASSPKPVEEKDLQLPKTKPLPPIGGNDNQEEETGEGEGEDKSWEDEENGSPGESQTAQSPAVESTPPRRLSFKRELTDDGASVRSAESRSSKRTVSFADGESSRPSTTKSSKKEDLAVRETSTRRGADGKEYVVVSVDSQTEWSWLEDLKSVGRSAFSRDPSPASKPASTEDEDEDEESSESPVTSTDEDTADDEPSSKSKSKSTTPKSKSATSTPSTAPSKPESAQSSAAYPQAAVSDDYGIPLLELSSESDFSDDDDSDSQPPGFMDDDMDMVQGIGPPQILQYKRESEDKGLEVDDPEKLAAETEPGATSFEDLFSAPCEFCGNRVKPFPTLEQQESQPPEDLYCCDQYRELVHFTLTHPLNLEHNQDQKIDVTPHPPHGSKLARKAAKERAAQREIGRIRAQMRMREREMQRQQVAAATLTAGLAPTNFVSSAATPNRISEIARQMKTINYQLSSQKCLEEGWTVRIPSPLRDDDGEPPIFVVEPLSEFGDDDEDYQFIDLMGSQYDGDTTNRDETDRTTARSKKAGKSAPSGKDEPMSPAKRSLDQSPHSADEGKRGKRPGKKAGEKGPPGKGKDKLQAGDGVQKRIGRLRHPGANFSFSLQDARIPEEEEERPEESPRKMALKALARARRRMLREWYYPSGTKFLTVFPDGSGNVFYPSGNIAIVISPVSRGRLSYIIHDDQKETGSQILGVFEPTGFAGCYFQNGHLRLYLDQFGGVEHDFQGGRKRRWSWKDQQLHVHAPPFQPICFSLNSTISVRVMSQANIALTFREKNRSCRFNVGSKLKLVNPSLIPPKEVDEDLLFINEVKAKVETLLNRVSNLLKFPKSPKLDKMKPPLHVTSMMERNEKLRKEAAGKGGKDKNKPQPVVSVN